MSHLGGQAEIDNRLLNTAGLLPEGLSAKGAWIWITGRTSRLYIETGTGRWT